MSVEEPTTPTVSESSANGSLLAITDLEVSLFFRESAVQVVRDLSISVAEGETVALVGESGCGKTMTALSVMRLLPDPPAKITDGSISLDGQNLGDLKPREMRAVRGGQISMIFQEPLTSFDPVFTVGSQVIEAIREHRSDVSKSDARDMSIEILREVQIPEAEKRIDAYPHELSGGMRQRVMIAMGLVLNPKVLIADEPTTALDVTTQAQILDLIAREQEQRNLGVLLITHNLAVVNTVADRVAVMYAGEIVEEGPAELIFSEPRHPYTQGLLRAVPTMNTTRTFLLDIPGRVPDPRAFPPACHFAPRCRNQLERCWQEMPRLESIDPQHELRCWNPTPLSDIEEPPDEWREDLNN